jgi:hypothetical protein
MRQTANLTAPFKLSFLSLSIALGMGVTASLSSSAEESGQAAKDISDLKGHVVKVGQDGSSSKDSDTQKDQSFGSLSNDGLGNGVAVPISETQEVSPTETKVLEEEPTKTASIEMPNLKKAPVQKGRAESDGTISHGESGVDWSKWVSQLADRWFLNLKNLEFRSAKVFRTARPALIRFTCYRNGTIGGVWLRQSCGVPEYDKMQIEALRRCTPLPAFPEGSVRMSYTLLQGWECHPREAGETDFKPGSFGKDFPVEHVGVNSKSHHTAGATAKNKPAGNRANASKAPAKSVAKPIVKPAVKTGVKPAVKAQASTAKKLATK